MTKPEEKKPFDHIGGVLSVVLKYEEEKEIMQKEIATLKEKCARYRNLLNNITKEQTIPEFESNVEIARQALKEGE